MDWNDEGIVSRPEQGIYRLRPERFLFVDHRYDSARVEVPAALLGEALRMPG